MANKPRAHTTSTPHDPTPISATSKVQGIDGKWRTLDSRTLHQATVALSASYNAFLADHAARLLGVSWVPVERRNSQFTGWEIDGVPTELVAEFSRPTLRVEGGEGIEGGARGLIEQHRAKPGPGPS